MNNDQLWQAVLGEIELNLSKANFTTWFKNTFVSSYENNEVIVCVPNTFTKAWLEKKYHNQISEALGNIVNEKIQKIFYKVEVRKTNPVGDLLKKIKIKKDENGNDQKLISINRFGLNNKYIFENFIVGKGNELAHAACQAVSANPGNAYNPLFIYGGVGLGKTHLLQAIGHEVLKTTDKIKYITCENFTNEYVQSIKTGKAKDFKDRYRNVDLLLIDDIQFMAGKDGTQEEFFHTFNELHQSNKQIIMTSDRPPKSIPALEKRLISRFEWGMIVDIVQPDIEIIGKSRKKELVYPRQITMYLMRNEINTSYPTIGHELGGRDHTTAMHAFNKISKELDGNEKIKQDIESIKQRIYSIN